MKKRQKKSPYEKGQMRGCFDTVSITELYT